MRAFYKTQSGSCVLRSSGPLEGVSRLLKGKEVVRVKAEKECLVPGNERKQR